MYYADDTLVVATGESWGGGRGSQDRDSGGTGGVHHYQYGSQSDG